MTLAEPEYYLNRSLIFIWLSMSILGLRRYLALMPRLVAYQDMTAKEFAAALDASGFLGAGEPVKVSDVTNAAKANAPFTRNSTPPTRPVRNIVERSRSGFPASTNSRFWPRPRRTPSGCTRRFVGHAPSLIARLRLVKDGGNSKSSLIYPIPDFYYQISSVSPTS